MADIELDTDEQFEADLEELRSLAEQHFDAVTEVVGGAATRAERGEVATKHLSASTGIARQLAALDDERLP